jgi:two-component system LytT family response regulator
VTEPAPRHAVRVLIVDDERPARQKIRRFMSDDADVSAIFEAADGVQAIELLRSEAPDVVFLDVQMPGVDGFGVLDAIAPEARPQIVFVTAFDEYAVRAFDANAIDYLLKPFDADRFARAFARAKHALARHHDHDERRRLERALTQVRDERNAPLERVLVEAGERVVLLPLTRVERFESDRNYVVVYAGADRYRLRTTLDRLEERLDPQVFVRIHRSTIVRADQVTELQPWSHGDYVVMLASGARVRLSRRYRDRLSRFVP